jgi:hypothetical protein
MVKTDRKTKKRSELIESWQLSEKATVTSESVVGQTDA